jgi:hypothetical protein
LLTAYTVPPPERSPASEAVLTMCPSVSWSIMIGRNVRTPWMTPIRLTPSTQCQSSRVLVQLGNPLVPTPALLQTTCTAPVLAERLLRERVDLLGLRDVGHHGVHVRAGVPEAGGGERERLLLDVAQHDAHAGLHERLAHAAPDAAGGSRDHGDLSFHVLHDDLPAPLHSATRGDAG